MADMVLSFERDWADRNPKESIEIPKTLINLSIFLQFVRRGGINQVDLF